MGKTKPKSKTAAIREELKNHGGSPKLVAEALQKQGLKVTAQYVSVIKAADKKKAMFNNARSATVQKQGLDATRELFADAIKLINRAGGIDEAHKVLDSAGSLLSHVR